MLHIVRKNESLEDIATLYGVNKEEISRIHYGNGKLKENEAIYVPVQYPCIFLENEVDSSKWEIEDRQKILELNAIKKDTFLPKNTRLYLPKKTTCFFSFGAVLFTEEENSFISGDLYARDFEALYIDCYRKHHGHLNLPKDYPALHLCRLHKIMPVLNLSNLSIFEDSIVFKELFYDISFKDYKSVLLHIEKTTADIAGKLISEFKKEGYRVSIAGTLDTICLFENVECETVYLKSGKNVFDFKDFKTETKKFTQRFYSRNKGYFHDDCYLFYNHERGTLSRLDFHQFDKLYNNNDSPGMLFDEGSMLCFLENGDKGDYLVYQDARSVYARAVFLKEHNICRTVFANTDVLHFSYADIIKQKL